PDCEALGAVFVRSGRCLLGLLLELRFGPLKSLLRFVCQCCLLDSARQARGSLRPFEVALLRHTLMLLAGVLDAVLVLAVAAGGKLPYHFVGAFGGIVERKAAIKSDPCSEPVAMRHGINPAWVRS